MTPRLSSLLGELGDHQVAGDADGRTEVRSVTQDSLSVEEGALYCCIVGTHVDAHDLAPSVVAAGAGSLLVERWLDVPVPQVRVGSTRQAVGPVAAAFWGRPSDRLSVVGVTGTNGKTTTTHLIASVLDRVGRRTGIVGTLSGARTTPEAPVLQAMLAQFLEDGCEAVAMEVSSIALDQHRVDGVGFQVGVWTNLTQDHLDYHGDLERYYTAKASLFQPGRCQLAVINADDPWGRRLVDELHIPAVTFGLADADDLQFSGRGSHFTWRGEHVDIPFGGAHNVSNALAAATACSALGITDADIAAGLSAAVGPPGRWERVDSGQDFGVVVDYAHTPDALEQVLQAARTSAATGGRVIVVFGCGGDRDRDKRPRMGAIAARLADVAILTSDNPRSEDPLAIIAETAAGARRPGDLLVRPDREQAITAAIQEARPGDIVVVAGKGHETTQVVGDQVFPFDDREVARRALAAVNR